MLIVGGGWGGLTAARSLRQLAPELDVVVVEKETAFWSNPLSNKWLVGLNDGRLLSHDTQAAASAFGYTLIRAEVTALDREQRQVITAQGNIASNWLILATGIAHDYSAWFGDDQAAAEHTRKAFPAAYTGPDEALALKKKLAAWSGGDLVMTIPPMPYRCPPAPYERAGMIAWWMKSRGIKGRIHVLDPNPIALGFDKVFRDTYRDIVVYHPQAQVRALDPFKKSITTDFDTLAFDEAILMPPQQAGDLVRQAGLNGQDNKGKSSGWAAVEPLTLRSVSDERIFLVGDTIDKVSPLFGHYPKTGQLASRLGQIAARQVAARALGKDAETRLPDSVCQVIARVEPQESMRIEAHYRQRGDGLIQQTVKQTYNAQASDEDVHWARGMFAQFLPS